MVLRVALLKTLQGCPVFWRDLWCTLPRHHTGVHYDAVADVRFIDAKIGPGWHYPPKPADTSGHSVTECPARKCHG